LAFAHSPLTFLDWLLLAVGGLGLAAGGLALLVPGRSQLATFTTRTKSHADAASYIVAFM
jgi:hypothetical protein